MKMNLYNNTLVHPSLNRFQFGDDVHDEDSMARYADMIAVRLDMCGWHDVFKRQPPDEPICLSTFDTRIKKFRLFCSSTSISWNYCHSMCAPRCVCAHVCTCVWEVDDCCIRIFDIKCGVEISFDNLEQSTLTTRVQVVPFVVVVVVVVAVVVGIFYIPV